MPFKPDSPTAAEVVAALQERFRAQRERGHWFRASPLEIGKAIGDREIIALYRTGEAKQRAAIRLANEQAKATAAELRASATVKERRRRRLQQRRAAAEMLVAGKTQAAIADALGISDRTIRNWAKGKAFQSALARAQARAERQSAQAEEPRAGASSERLPAVPSLVARRIPKRRPIRAGTQPDGSTRASTPTGSTSETRAAPSRAPSWKARPTESRPRPSRQGEGSRR